MQFQELSQLPQTHISQSLTDEFIFSYQTYKVSKTL